MVITFFDQPRDTIAPGVTLSRLAPGGKDGPDGVVRNSDHPAGATWSEIWSLGRPEDRWRLTIPDVRMAPNQIWPAHWHDCWTAVVILDGSMMIGDWWMSRGDVLIAEPGVEYGLLLNGPAGCQLLEIFARDVLSPGGYAPEYRDHPTLVYLQGVDNLAFGPRPPGSQGNEGHQCIPCDATSGLHKSHLDGAGCCDLGDPDDPERAVLLHHRLRPGAGRPATSYGDWRALLVLEGRLAVGDAELEADDLLLIEPHADVPDRRAGSDGAHVLDIVRTAAGCEPAELARAVDTVRR